MAADISIRNYQSQVKRFPVEIHSLSKGAISCGMAKSAASAPRRNYLDGWMKLLGAKNKDLAPAARVTPSYISNLRRNARKPTVDVMLAISEALRVSVNDLYRPAPAESAVATLREYAPETLRTITKRARRA